MWVKICGMTDQEAVDAALAAGADALGFVFSPSVRRLEPEQALQLAARARGRAAVIAVTLHPPQPLIDEIVRLFSPDALQAEQSDFERLRLPQALGRLPVLRAEVAAGGALPPRMLFDGARCGSGEAADWQAAARLARRSELILAGGLTAHNVGAAIAAVRPYGVDVSSSVESAPGRKSVQKIAEFVAAARAAVQAIPGRNAGDGA